MASASTGRGISRLAALLQSKWPPAIFPSREIAPFGSRMASGQVVRGRMKSIRSIQKITKAMKMVAASKLRGVQVKVEGSRGIPLPFVSLLGDTPDLDATKQIVVCVSSDRGLCGGINSTSVKISKALSKMATAATKDAKYVVIGEKGKSQLLRDSRKQIAMNITEIQKVGICFSQVSMMADEILKGLEYDSLKLVFNRFQSVVSFEATVATVLSPELVEKETAMGGKLAYVDNYEIEGDELKLQILQNLSEFSFAAQLFNALLENTASEMGARMSAMDNSSKNASEMLETLTLSYNRSRQTKITTELIEIISGASALEA